MVPSKVACFLMFVLFCGANKTENVEISEGNEFDFVHVSKITSANILCS